MTFKSNQSGLKYLIPVHGPVNGCLLEAKTQQQLHLVLPEGNKAYPLFIWICGGAWSYGDKDEELDFARQLARQGIGVVCVAHRRSPATWRDPQLNQGIRHLGQVADLAAVGWLYEQQATYGY